MQVEPCCRCCCRCRRRRRCCCCCCCCCCYRWPLNDFLLDYAWLDLGTRFCSIPPRRRSARHESDTCTSSTDIAPKSPNAARKRARILRAWRDISELSRSATNYSAHGNLYLKLCRTFSCTVPRGVIRQISRDFSVFRWETIDANVFSIFSIFSNKLFADLRFSLTSDYQYSYKNTDWH